ncbi:hypothetical protein [Methylophaga sp.]|uniref:hypothetical protein n=1 Tax=Methylophaga sp. TaxID=2024840 RepID=UPI003F6A1A90
MTNKLKVYLLILVVSLVIACIPMQEMGGAQLSQMLKVTLTVYALARGLNAVISVAQGTEMSIEPMGVGVTLTPGELLDPLNDLIEQVSTILLMASASLGVQNILLALGDHPVIRVGIAISIIVTIILILMRGVSLDVKQGVIKLVLILSLLRLAVPAVAIVSLQAQDWLATERQQAIKTLQSTRDDVDLMNTQNTEEERSWLDGFKNKLDIQTKVNSVKYQAEQSVEAAIYILSEFMLIMIFFPLLFVYLLIRLTATIRLH